MRQKTFNNKKLNLLTLNLMHKYMIRSLIGLLISSIGTFAYLLLYFFISKTKGNAAYFAFSIASAIGISSLSISLITIPGMNIDFRKSIFLRKLHLEGVSKYRYNLLLFAYFFSVQLSIAILALLFYVFLGWVGKGAEFEKHQMNTWSVIKGINYWELMYGALWTIVLSISAGMLISTFIKSTLFAQVLGFGLFFLSLLFGGSIINPADWDYAKFMQYLSVLSPLSYPITAMNVVTIPSIKIADLEFKGIHFNSLFDFTSNIIYNTKIDPEVVGAPQKVAIQYWMKPIYAFLPIPFTGLFLGISLWKFNFLSR